MPCGLITTTCSNKANLPELGIRICDPKCIPIIYIMKTKIIKNFYQN